MSCVAHCLSEVSWISIIFSGFHPQRRLHFGLGKRSLKESGDLPGVGKHRERSKLNIGGLTVYGATGHDASVLSMVASPASSHPSKEEFQVHVLSKSDKHAHQLLNTVHFSQILSSQSN